MQVLIIDGHPDTGRLSEHLLDVYASALAADTKVTRVALRDVRFDALAMRSYAQIPELEPDLARLWDQIVAADHLVLAFPMWWGAEPALVAGFVERVFLPGRAFAYHPDDIWWDRLLAGRSADLVITMDTPPMVLRWLWGFPIGKRWRRQVLGFVGFDPVRIYCFGPVRRRAAQKGLPKWRLRIESAARSAVGLTRKPKGQS